MYGVMSYVDYSWSMTIQRCRQAAGASGYVYAALQLYGAYGSVCLGGNDIAVYVTRGVCNWPCGGAPFQICGGDGMKSLFFTSDNPGTGAAELHGASFFGGERRAITPGTGAEISCGFSHSPQYVLVEGGPPRSGLHLDA